MINVHLPDSVGSTANRLKPADVSARRRRDMEGYGFKDKFFSLCKVAAGGWWVYRF